MTRAAGAVFLLLALSWAGAALLSSCNGGPTVQRSTPGERPSPGAHRAAVAER